MSTIRQSGIWAFLGIGLSVLMCACSSLPKGHADLDVGMKERGIASWYGDDFHGWVTASGDVYDMYALTGAHRTLPLGTIVRVTNVVNGKQVRIRINDRGPYVNGRILDLSYAAADQLAMIKSGISSIYLEVVGHPAWDSSELLSPVAMLEKTLAMILPLSGSDLTQRQGSDQVVAVAARGERSFRQIPSDLLHERRVRRPGDSLAAAGGADRVAALQVA